MAAFWYLVVTSVLMVGQYYLERYYARGASRKLTTKQLEALAKAQLGGDGSPPPMTLMVKAERVCKNFGALKVLKGVTLEVGRGQVLVLVGPSGSGKSTFLRCINHLEQVNAGRLYVDGELIGYRERGDKLYEMPPREAAKQRRDIGMVFQHFNLFPHRTALREHHRGADARQGRQEEGSGGKGQGSAESGGSVRRRRTLIRRSSPAARRSGWLSPERWP